MRATLLEAPELDAFGQMGLDEALLDAAGPGSLILRFYRWPGGPRDAKNPHALTFGYFQRCEEAAREASRRGISSVVPLVRRPTGGGVVVHDLDLTFSLVFPWSKLASPSLVYKDLHRGVHLGLKAEGVSSQLWSPPSPSSQPILSCFAAPSPMDLVDDQGRKFLGGALRRRRGVGLYQGSLRLEGLQSTRERLKQAVLHGLSLEWKASFIPRDASGPELEQAERLRGERYATEDWNKKR